MAPRVERVNKHDEYVHRTGGCSCHSKYTSYVPPAEGSSKPINKPGFLSKYAGPLIFGALIIAAALVSECTRNGSAPESKLESKANGH